MKRLVLALMVAPFVWAAHASTAPARNPGVVFQIETVASASAAPQVIEARIEGQNARITAAGQQSDAIYHGSAREMVIVNHGNKSYVVMDEATMQQMAASLNQAMAQMQKMLESVPESQRQAMENMMKGRGMGTPQPPAQIRRTDERATQNGFATVKYEVLRGGTKTQELWVTPWANVTGFQEARPVFESMAGFFKSMMENMPQMGAATRDDAFGYFDQLDGFPVVTQNFDAAGQPTSKSTLKSVENRTIPASEFQPPAGYTQQQLPQMGRGR